MSLANTTSSHTRPLFASICQATKQITPESLVQEELKNIEKQKVLFDPSNPTHVGFMKKRLVEGQANIAVSSNFADEHRKNNPVPMGSNKLYIDDPEYTYIPTYIGTKSAYSDVSKTNLIADVDFGRQEASVYQANETGINIRDIIAGSPNGVRKYGFNVQNSIPEFRDLVNTFCKGLVTTTAEVIHTGTEGVTREDLINTAVEWLKNDRRPRASNNQTRSICERYKAIHDSISRIDSTYASVAGNITDATASLCTIDGNRFNKMLVKRDPSSHEAPENYTVRIDDAHYKLILDRITSIQADYTARIGEIREKELSIRKKDDIIAEMNKENTKLTRSNDSLKQELANKEVVFKNKLEEVEKTWKKRMKKMDDSYKQQLESITTKHTDFKKSSDEELASLKSQLEESQNVVSTKDVELSDLKSQLEDLQESRKHMVLKSDIEALKQEIAKMHQDNETLRVHLRFVKNERFVMYTEAMKSSNVSIRTFVRKTLQEIGIIRNGYNVGCLDKSILRVPDIVEYSHQIRDQYGTFSPARYHLGIYGRFVIELVRNEYVFSIKFGQFHNDNDLVRLFGDYTHGKKTYNGITSDEHMISNKPIVVAYLENIPADRNKYTRIIDSTETALGVELNKMYPGCMTDGTQLRFNTDVAAVSSKTYNGERVYHFEAIDVNKMYKKYGKDIPKQASGRNLV